MKTISFLKLYKLLYKLYKDTLNEFHPPVEDAFQFTIYVILTARTLDSRVVSVVPKLFKLYPDVYSMSKAEISHLEAIIKPVGIYKIKSKNIIKLSKILISKYNGNIPNSMLSLIKLPGIGRKTANVILPHVFKKPGFAVDTHVKRVLNRIGILNSYNTFSIEKIVIDNISSKYWAKFSLLLITHGRNQCKSIVPKCKYCNLKEMCLFFISNENK